MSYIDPFNRDKWGRDGKLWGMDTQNGIGMVSNQACYFGKNAASGYRMFLVGYSIQYDGSTPISAGFWECGVTNTGSLPTSTFTLVQLLSTGSGALPTRTERYGLQNSSNFIQSIMASSMCEPNGVGQGGLLNSGVIWVPPMEVEYYNAASRRVVVQKNQLSGPTTIDVLPVFLILD